MENKITLSYSKIGIINRAFWKLKQLKYKATTFLAGNSF